MSHKRPYRPDLKDWTKDSEGKFVDWTKQPYRRGPLLRITLEGEDPDRISSETRRRRIMEYYALLRRQAMDNGQKRVRP